MEREISGLRGESIEFAATQKATDLPKSKPESEDLPHRETADSCLQAFLYLGCL